MAGRRAAASVLGLIASVAVSLPAAASSTVPAPTPSRTGHLSITVEITGSAGPSESPDAEPSAGPGATAPQTPPAAGSGGGLLPRTGDPVLRVLVIGLLLLVAGAVLRRVRRAPA